MALIQKQIKAYISRECQEWNNNLDSYLLFGVIIANLVIQMLLFLLFDYLITLN